ncbi:hypothetical protein M404DRAFT_998894, partial [Pisolithus tinctorius Marx 270]
MFLPQSSLIAVICAYLLCIFSLGGICYTTIWPPSITRPRRGIGRPNPISHALSTYRYPLLVGKFQGPVPKRL